MKEKVLKAVSTLPFCIPFPFIFLCIDYYLKDEHTWIAALVASTLGIISFEYAIKGKIKEIFVGHSVGLLISAIVTSIVNDGFDESWFSPLTSISYIFVLFVAVVIVSGFWILAAKLVSKIKSKMKK